ncbi:fido domain-containing protein [Armillaria nabsnona]|nr:fido domain-containing protein [Armillaria nabsnona]
METNRFGETYIPPGQTRTSTKKTVVTAGNYKIQCCPFPEVDNKLDYICKMAKQHIENWRNPFATASWIHLLLARCHLFNDGNGRTTRLIASIPLMMHGCPPISIGLTLRSDYYDAINKARPMRCSRSDLCLTEHFQAYGGDHLPLIECILRGMEMTIANVRSI